MPLAMTRILRAVRSGPALERAPIADARQEADAIRARARLQAEELLHQARAEQEQLRASAAREGLEQAGARVAERMLELDEAQRAALEALEPQVLELGLRAARHIVASELAIRPEAALAIVRSLLEPLRHARQVVVLAHPEDCAVLRDAFEPFSRSAQLELRPDASIERGGAVLRSDVGSLDARVDVRLEALAKLLSKR
jgi:flagellar biosynthesis/type III secretory pathway protein FliH